MLFLADTYNTYLGNFQMHVYVKKNTIIQKIHNNTKKYTILQKTEILKYKNTQKNKSYNQVLRGGGVMCSKNITQLVKEACQALHTG